MKKVVIFIFALAIVLSLGACGGDNGIVGTWRAAEEWGLDGLTRFTFSEDGHFTDGDEYRTRGHGTYSIVGNELILNYVEPSTQGTLVIDFEIDGRTMILRIWGGEATFIRE